MRPILTAAVGRAAVVILASVGAATPRTAGPRKLAAWLAFIGTLAALNYAGNLTSSGGDSSDFVYEWSGAILGAVQVGIMVGLALWIAAGLPLRPTFALYRPRSWARALGLGLAVFVGALALATALEPLLPAGEEQGLTPDGWDGSRAPQFVASFVVIAGLVPVVEELVFRGLGVTLLLPYLGVPLTVAASGLIFALAHGLLYGLPVLVLFGAALAFLRTRTGSIYPCIVTHALFNSFALIASVVLGERGGS